jgi:hypothetical protein
MSEVSFLRHRQSRAESSADLLDNENTQDDEHVESVYQNPVRNISFLVLFPQTSSVIEKPKPL